MPKIARELKALEVAKLRKPGLHMVGTVAGLGLSVAGTGSRSWILRTMIGSKRCGRTLSTRNNGLTPSVSRLVRIKNCLS